MSADSTKVLQIFGYRQEKRFTKALEHLACAYESNLAAEEAVLEALVEIGGEGENATLTERWFCFFLQARAESIKKSGRCIQQIMRDISQGVTYGGSEELTYEGSEESSED